MLLLLAAGERYGGEAALERGLPGEGEVHEQRRTEEGLQIPVQGEAVRMRPCVVARWAAAGQRVSVRHRATRPLAEVHRRERPNGG